MNKSKRNKAFISMGLLSVATIPVVAVVSCGSSESSKSEEVKKVNVVTPEAALNIQVQGKSAVPSNKIEGNDEIFKMISDNSSIEEVKKLIETYDLSSTNENLTIVEVSSIKDGTKIVQFDVKDGDKIVQLTLNFEGYGKAKIAPNDPSKIGQSEFENIKLPQDFKIPSTVKTIDKYAFRWVMLPKDFQIPNTVKSIGDAIFDGATLPKGFKNPKAWYFKIPALGYGGANLNSDFVIPGGVTEIGIGAFWKTELPKDFQIPDTLENIRNKAFWNAKLPNGFKIPNNFIFFNSDAFLDPIVSNPDEGWYDPNTGIKHNSPKPGFVWYYEKPLRTNLNIQVQGKSAVPSNKIEGAEEIFKMISDNSSNEEVKDLLDTYDLSSTNENLTIEEVSSIKDGIKVVRIDVSDGDETVKLTFNFEGYGKAKIAIADPSKISQSEFNNIKLPQDFKIPDTVTSIEFAAFRGAKLPKGFQIPDSVISVSSSIFSETTLPEGFKNPKAWSTIMQKHAYSGATLNSDFVIPESVILIEEFSFEEATLPNDFKIPDTVKGIGNAIFYKTNLPQGFQNPKAWSETIGKQAYWGAIINSDFKIPDTVKIIDNSAFNSATLPNGFKIPNTVTTLKLTAFENIKTSHPNEGWYDPNTGIKHDTPQPGFVWYYEKP